MGYGMKACVDAGCSIRTYHFVRDKKFYPTIWRVACVHAVREQACGGRSCLPHELKEESSAFTGTCTHRAREKADLNPDQGTTALFVAVVLV